MPKEQTIKNFDEREDETAGLNRREFLAGAAGGLLALQSSQVLAGSSGNSTDESKSDMSNKDNQTELDFLKKYSTTILESAVALIQGGSHAGIVFTRPGFERRTTGAERLVGYAVTAVFSTDPDDERGRRENLDYWNYVSSQPAPKIAVALDASKEPGSGSSWGQINARLHRALGCRGALTNGGVRDIDVIRTFDFTMFSGSLTVGHGNPHWVKFGEPIELYGARFVSGDVVCVDEHGAIVIPKNLLPNIEEAAAEGARRSKIIAEYCQSPNFTPGGLANVMKKVRPATPWKPTGR